MRVGVEIFFKTHQKNTRCLPATETLDFRRTGFSVRQVLWAMDYQSHPRWNGVGADYGRA